ncbi:MULTISPECIES: RES family NAD+ phosphorylase [unclassified Mesorhizobium]|uniref:RES family NAD+ phosphorylase n=1 Tax=unclassified Mesorhizobium TaxID=325217 RepID=UPI000FCA40CD|nr:MULTISPECIES: RES family NAD+ phosphorylase [unclassified Mesorhizobium]RWB66041.1 MAG: RES domain-containing protein [Mesorhizobium sp.]RWG15716.1 MAG: RES domain-containing protein [Mesorhizobium sp.]TGP21396.1 RES domain-containing protein [Mesorhizobium sp. M1D.F.Ca.ET.231.01.1.1]TGP28842.1 RES domain-containing protein [Mesorhizobium sp. M1D.F.Ca.ET.234.01.1.1]TGS43310.1 RES domain-containing protein [Mesorhizobium sp. M1D.F.Ca.ET.184.01.1.1]
MRLWRLSSLQYANAMDGGYGLLFDGRWNTVGHPVTYAATSPSLCILEKLVHVEDPALLPALAMVAYDISDEIPASHRSVRDLPADWRQQEAMTQRLGDEWLTANDTALLFVPSAIVPIADSPDRNVLINPRHSEAAAVQIARVERFELDIRLLRE